MTATTIVVGGGCKWSSLNFYGLAMHSFHRLIAISLPLSNLDMVSVLNGYEEKENCSWLDAM